MSVMSWENVTLSHPAHVFGPDMSAAVIVPCPRTPLKDPGIRPAQADAGPPDRTAMQLASSPLVAVLGLGASQTRMSPAGDRWMCAMKALVMFATTTTYSRAVPLGASQRKASPFAVVVTPVAADSGAM